MIRAAATLILLAAPAAAESCDTWQFDWLEGEGGSAPAAHICAETVTGRNATLILHCGGPSEFNLYYDDGGSGAPPGGDPDWVGQLTFASGEISLTEDTAYMAMDSTLHVPVRYRAALYELLRNGDELRLTPSDPQILAQSFTLKGSARALQALLPECAWD